MSDPWKGTALRAAEKDEPVNRGHRYTVKTLDDESYADEVRIDPRTGHPSWWVDCGDHQIASVRHDDCVVRDFRPMTREEFRKLPGLIE